MIYKVDYTTKQGFLLHSADHWFAIRKVMGVWYDLNSLQKSHKPIKIKDFYLSAFLDSAVKQGYTIYVVHGKMSMGKESNLPLCDSVGSMLEPN